MTIAKLATSSETAERLADGLMPIDGAYVTATFACDVKDNVVTIRASHSSCWESGRVFKAPAYVASWATIKDFTLYAEIPDSDPMDPRGSDEIIYAARKVPDAIDESEARDFYNRMSE